MSELRLSTLALRLPAVALLLLIAAPLSAAQITVLNMDPAGQGLNDPTPVSALPGNPGTTLGQQRLNVFQAAADYWGARLQSNVPIVVEATMLALDCNQNSALLGQAGAANAFRDWNGAPMSNVWYPVALANALAGQDLDPDESDILAQFNSALDDDPNCLGGAGWFYGIDAPAPSGQLDFYTTVQHEMGHGVGFASFVDESTGEKLIGFDDIFSTFLRDESSGKSWGSMSNGERKNSAINTGKLTWTGQSASTGAGVFTGGKHPSGRVRMYAPNPVEPGSSVSHWDTEATPNELMEPFITDDAENLITTALLEDIGWGTLTQTFTCVPDADTLCLGANNRFEVEVSWRDFAGKTGVGKGTEISTTSGLLYFFNPNNLEMLIKVLDGCGFNDRFWVFFAATTDVEFQVVVTDSQTGLRRTYTNDLGQPANAITDTSAFSTCSSRSSSRVTDVDPTAFGRRLAQETTDLLDELQRSSREAVQLVGPQGQVRTAMPLYSDRVVQMGDFATLLARSSEQSTSEAPPLDRLRVDSEGTASGPDGTVYTPRPLMGTSVDQMIFTLQRAGSNDVVFDNKTESLARYDSSLGLNTLPRVKESASLRSDGVTLDVEITILSKDADDLFPAGFVANGNDLDAGGISIGAFSGEKPLSFPHKRLNSASLSFYDDAQFLGKVNLDASELPSGQWNGILFPLMFSNIAGLGVDGITLDAVFTLEGGGDGGGDGPGEDGPPVTPFTCQPGTGDLCLNDSRFEVEVDWRDFTGNTGTGKAQPIVGSTDSGLFWFFNPNNIEMLIKVLDGCSLNDRYWVFFAATTDVEFTVTVTDSDTGKVRLYSNELGQPADAITDTSAFATCP